MKVTVMCSPRSRAVGVGGGERSLVLGGLADMAGWLQTVGRREMVGKS